MLLLSTSVFYHFAAVASWATLSLSMAIEKPNAASPNPRIAKRELRDLPFFQNLEYNQATPLAIDPNPAMQVNLQEQRQLQFEQAVFGATEIARFALELRPDDIVYRLFFGNANAEQQATIRRNLEAVRNIMFRNDVDLQIAGTTDVEADMAAVTGTGLNRVLTLGPSFFELPQFRTMLLEENQVRDILTGVHNPEVNMNNLLTRHANQGLLIFHELLHVIGEAPLDRAPRADEFGVTPVVDARMDNDAELERSQGDIYRPMEAIAAVRQHGPARAIRNAANYEWLGLLAYLTLRDWNKPLYRQPPF